MRQLICSSLFILFLVFFLLPSSSSWKVGLPIKSQCAAHQPLRRCFATAVPSPFHRPSPSVRHGWVRLLRLRLSEAAGPPRTLVPAQHSAAGPGRPTCTPTSRWVLVRFADLRNCKDCGNSRPLRSDVSSSIEVYFGLCSNCLSGYS